MKYKNRLNSTVAAFWNGDGFSIKDTEGWKIAIKRATKDLMARTLKRKAPESENFTDNIIAVLIPRLEAWFCKPQADVSEENFDTWHQESCSAVLTVLREFYSNQDGTDVAYGKAQKIVNMTMKGLYCLVGATDLNRHFQYCHMALDSFILEWFSRNVMSWYNEGKKTKDKLKKASMVSWSVIPEGSGIDPYGYDTYVQHIREYFASTCPYDGLTPLQAEFFIWTEIQLAMAAEALYGQDIGKEEAVAEAQARWNIQWTVEQQKDVNKQFARCKQEFKLRPLEEKVEFLRTRVEQLCKYVNIGVSTCF